MLQVRENEISLDK